MALIRLTGLSFAYPDRPRVLDGLELTLGVGERLVVTGRNGSGKSTLFRLIVGLLTPEAGAVECFGAARRTDADFREVRRRVGLVFQDPDDMLFCPTVLEDVAFGPLNLGQRPAEAEATARRVLDTLEIGDFADRVTHHLSGGEKRLVSLAAVLAMDPEVLLLDEPSNALDEASEHRLVAVLDRLEQPMIIVSHDRHFHGRLGTRTLKLDRGRLSEVAPRCRHRGPV